MSQEPQLPLAISLVGGKYLLFDVDAVTWLRKNHQICGVMGGTLPQSPSQNVFLGLPMQIMPEEAQLLLEKGVAYIVDDARAHDQAINSGDSTRHAEYIARIRRKAEAASRVRAGQKDEQRKQALSKQKSKSKKTGKSTEEDTTPISITPDTTNDIEAVAETEESLFDTPTSATPVTPQTWSQLASITPTTSHLFVSTHPPEPSESSNLSTSSSTPTTQIPTLQLSYPLYRHLHNNSYFMTPGLRFGCQYCVYPGDPLRFHSHFLAVCYGWDDEINLMDLVGGGRLGTGVKKGFLIGAVEPRDTTKNIINKSSSRGKGLGLEFTAERISEAGEAGHESGTGKSDGKNKRQHTERIRTFSIEWAAM